LDLLVCVPLSGGMQFLARATTELRASLRSRRAGMGLLIYGAGVAGVALAREIRSNPKLGYRVLGFLDDDPRKESSTLLGLPVFGPGKRAAQVVSEHRNEQPPIQEIAVAMPSATGRQIRTAQALGRSAGVPCRIVPGLGELMSGEVHLDNSRPVSVTDLLGREPIQLPQDSIRLALADRSVLVTGGAGSIGSELCDQLAQLDPSRLVIMDQAESEMFRLEVDLRRRHPGLHLIAEIGDIRDERRVEEIVQDHRVDSIFHAAAYKHVPLMERHVCEAVRNNVIGTWNVVQAAWRANASSVLLISSDKAVNPSSVMGLTKRVAELIVSSDRPPIGRGRPTRFVCVRFGNVLVSNGSVIPIFQRQIAAGGPVTVTHPEMRRYFMTVQEAVQLILEASTMGKRSEIFVLDMGGPMRIVELARKMIRMAGLVPDEDIEIQFTGTRPGEKLFEELRLTGEDLLPTANKRLRIFQGQTIAFSTLVQWIAELQQLLSRRDADAVLSHLCLLVPEYQPIVPAHLHGASSPAAVSLPREVLQER
jgi:FlaA1/EpsC-like NDP-sugar epimerase